MLKTSIFTAILSIAFLFQACSDKEEGTQNSITQNTIPSNQFELVSTDNKQYIVKKENNGFILENAKGKIVIFDIFATWCPPCQASASHLSSLQNKFKDDLIIIGLTIENEITLAKLNAFKKEYNATYAISHSPARLLINEIATALELGKRHPIPVMAMYKDGKLINHYIGEVQEEFIESDIRRALGK